MSTPSSGQVSPESLQTWKDLIDDNPMLDEGKRSWRKIFRHGKIGPIVGLVLFSVLYLWTVIQSFVGGSDNSSFFAYLELILLTLFMPGSIHNAISGERELATWDALVLTRLTAGQIVFGKLLWRIWTMLILAALCIIPMLISRIDDHNDHTTILRFFLAQIFLISWGLLVCSFGLWVSSATKRSITSLMVIAGTLIGLLIVFPALLTMFESLLDFNVYNHPSILDKLDTAFNPFSSLGTVLNLEGDNDTTPYLRGSRSGILQIVVYLFVSVFFMFTTFLRIKKLTGQTGGQV